MEEREQPINWERAIVSGAVSAIFMMAFIDIFNMLGITPFSFEIYLGSLIRETPYGHHNWTVGFLANTAVGGVFGVLYAYFFEYIFSRAGSRLGVRLGFVHALVAALAVFPFFNSIHEFMGVEVYPKFGLLGLGLGGPSFILLITAHLLFGASMGTFYGDVRIDRVRNRLFEPGRVGLAESEDAITPTEDPEDRMAV